MTVDSVGGATATSQPAGANSLGNLGGDAFLQLLVTKLKNQDPTNPQSDTDFIAQLAQFSSLEQLTSINRAVTDLSAIVSDLLSQRASAVPAATHILEGKA